MMFAVAAVAILLSMAFALIGAIKGPRVYDRIVSINAFGTLTVVLIAVYGFLDGRPEFLDIALVYALINFIGTIAVSKFVSFRALGHPAGEHRDGDI